MTPIFNGGAAGNIFVSVLGILIMVFAGYVAAKKNLITQGGIGEISKLVFNISIPSLILTKMLTSYNKEMFFHSLYLPVFAVINILIVNFFLAKAAAAALKLPEKDKHTFRYLCTFQNYTYMPLPLVAMVFGPQYLIYVILFGVTGDIINYTFGVRMFDRKHSVFSPKVFAIPGFLAIVAGFVMVFTGSKLPDGIIKPLDFLGSTSVPLAMIVTGGVAAGIKLKHSGRILKDKKMIALVALKLIITPVIILLMTIPFKLDPIVRSIIVLQASMPSAFMAIIFSKQFGKNAELAAAGALVTTILSAITVPLIFCLL